MEGESLPDYRARQIREALQRRYQIDRLRYWERKERECLNISE